MFGIGFSEFAIIALLCVIVIKPDDLPAFFRKMGRLFAQAKSAYKEVTAVKDDFLREMDIAAAIQDADKAQAEAAKVEPTPPVAVAEASSDGNRQEDEIKVEE